MILVNIALLGRIFLLGYEKIVVKKLSNGVRSESSAFLYFFIAAVSLIPTLVFVSGTIHLKLFIPLIISSIVYGVAYLFYIKALSSGEASLIAPLYNLSLLFLLLLTTIFLGEKLSLAKMGGILLLLYGASLLGEGENLIISMKNLTQNKASLYMVIASFFIASGRVIDGYAVGGVNPLIYAFGINLGISMFFLIYILSAKSMKKTIALFKERPKIAILSGTINSYSYLLLVFAFTHIDVSIAEPASMLSTVVTVILAHFIFGENIGKRLIPAIIMVCGVWLLFL